MRFEGEIPNHKHQIQGKFQKPKFKIQNRGKPRAAHGAPFGAARNRLLLLF
jgi:hypothetical protein